MLMSLSKILFNMLFNSVLVINKAPFKAEVFSGNKQVQQTFVTTLIIREKFLS